MGKSVLELAVSTGRWEAGLKKAQQALNNFTDDQGGFQAALQKDSKNMQGFIQMMGSIDSHAKTSRGQLNDYKNSFEQLTIAYNQMSDAEKRNPVGQAMSKTLDQLRTKIEATRQQMDELNKSMNGATPSTGAGLFGGGKLDGMLQVFGGNLMTKGAGMLAGLASEMGDMVKQGVELAKQGEGIRIAFERLGRGDILDGLREATHGTVTDLELMKAAVKFNDFKLPLDELGTMLAFAQQKAKDTGQSVDYMVDSIVTGLGRKSLMILDNLGLSAAQIKEKMAETGDMTKAVGAIIREEMAKAGDYVETAADRATQANVQLENAMTRLGETFQPLTDTANSMWTSIKIGALDLLNNAVKPLIKALQEAGALGQKARGNAGYENLGGDAKINRLIANLGDGKSPKAYRTYKAQMAEFDRYANSLKFKIASYGDDKSGIAQSAVAKLQTELAGVLTMRMEYDRRAQELHKKATAKNIDDNKEEEQSIDSLKKKLAELQEQRKKAIAAGDNDLSKNLLKQINQVKADIKGLGGTTTTTTTHKPTTAEQIAFDINKAGISSAKGVDTMPSVWAMADKNAMRSSMNGWNDVGTFFGIPPSIWDAIRKQTGLGYQQFDLGRDISKGWQLDSKGQLVQKKDKDAQNADKTIVSEMGKLTSGVSGIFSGIEQMGIEVPNEIKSVINGLNGIMTILTSINTILGVIEGLQTVGVLPFFAHGGIVPHAATGLVVPGNDHADKTPVLVSSGELILNSAQQNALANELQGGGLRNLRLRTEVSGRNLIVVIENDLAARGKGQLATFKS